MAEQDIAFYIRKLREISADLKTRTSDTGRRYGKDTIANRYVLAFSSVAFVHPFGFRAATETLAVESPFSVGEPPIP